MLDELTKWLNMARTDALKATRNRDASKFMIAYAEDLSFVPNELHNIADNRRMIVVFSRQL